MKTVQILGCLLLVAFSSTAALAAETVPVFRVSSSPVMKVAIINADQKNPANERMHKAFVASLGFQISQCYQSAVAMEAVAAEPLSASLGLSDGTYDLVAVIGTNVVPTILANGEFKRYQAMPTTGNPRHAVHLLVNKDDNTLANLLDRSFSTVLNEKFFQLAFSGYRKSTSEREMTEWNVAIASLR